MGRTVCTRLSEEEYEWLEAMSRVTGYSKSQVLRMCFKVVVALIETGAFKVLRPLPEILRAMEEGERA